MIKRDKSTIRTNNRAITIYRLNQRGLTHNEIADHFGIASSRIKALIKLGERLENLNEEA